MKLGITYQELNTIYRGHLQNKENVIDSVIYDTRKIISGANSLFFAIKGSFRDGHTFIPKAYEKGVRVFVVESLPDISPEDAQFICVPNSLTALQELATYHRKKFTYPVVAITGSAGKTIVKEWLAQVLSSKYRVIRSPKSYNSQLGVALSLLELTAACDVAVIEAGISEPNEMERLQQMILPTHGIFTSLGSAHADNFKNREEQLNEKLKLFEGASQLIAHESIKIAPSDTIRVVQNKKYLSDFRNVLDIEDSVRVSNAALVLEMAMALGMSKKETLEQLSKVENIALRSETFEGINNSLIINDTYSMDLDAFRSSLEYQVSLAKNRRRIVVIDEKVDQSKIDDILANYQPIDVYFVDAEAPIVENCEDSVVLIKGLRSSAMERHAAQYRIKKHQTYLEINLDAIRKNIETIKKKLYTSTKILVMVKASSYGSGGVRIAKFLERIGVDYLGVAYADEGVELREAGVSLPILVMNAEEAGFDDCIKYDLEPAIYSMEQLEGFIKSLIYQNKTNYPIHIKLETGMKRLGFDKKMIPSLMQKLTAQPEIKIESIYSHLSDADNPESSFVAQQFDRYLSLSASIENHISYPVLHHLLNSEGCINFPSFQLDMVRLGIAIYGFSSNPEMMKSLEPVISWYSSVSQIKEVAIGESVGYTRDSIAEKPMKIAIIPIGYADGLRRSMSKGKGGVYIRNHYCPIVGNVCMDMIMVDVTDLNAETGDRVEIIGVHQTIQDLSTIYDTIPYEVLTGISKRVHRSYIEN